MNRRPTKMSPAFASSAAFLALGPISRLSSRFTPPVTPRSPYRLSVVVANQRVNYNAHHTTTILSLSTDHNQQQHQSQNQANHHHDHLRHQHQHQNHHQTTSTKTKTTKTTTTSSSSSSSLHSVLRVKRQNSNTSEQNVMHVANRAVTPMRRPRDDPTTTYTTEDPTLPSQRRTDMLAPKTTGIWAFVPYVAASAVLLGTGWIAKKRLVARQERLVTEFGDVMVLYGTTPDSQREIASEYKRKLGPGILREAMYSSFLRVLISDKPIEPSTIQDVALVKRLLRLSDERATNAMNALGAQLKDAPSLLGKLLFLANRIVPTGKTSKLSLVSHFPYSPETVDDLQRNMLERCYKEYVDDEIEANAIETPPLDAAALLRIDPVDAQTLFDSVIAARLRKKEAEEARIAEELAEQAAKPDDTRELDSPARPAEPAKANVHAYQCGDCGYTLFPAAGREFKFYGDDFVCPACGAPKSKFIDLNEEE